MKSQICHSEPDLHFSLQPSAFSLSVPLPKLNLGCGHDIRAGYLNLDAAPLPGVDLVHDIHHRPWPFPDATFREVLCQSILEHVDLVPTLREIHRVLQPGGRLRLTVPHFTSVYAFQDPTHRNLITCGTFDFFTRHSHRPYYFDFAFHEIESLRLHFGRRRLFWWNPLLERWVNAHPGRRALYETSPLRLFPASHITAILKK